MSTDKQAKEAVTVEPAAKRIIPIDGMVTVGSLAEALSVAPTTLMTELFKNGVMVTINEKIDFTTAQIIVEELGLDVQLERRVVEDTVPARSDRVLTSKAKSRPPVVAVMGHVDHGKTSLLDAVRGASVAKGEAGGITQHISAYQVKHGDREITFLDTPGHEAFAALREHGAMLTDLVVVVIAADDGIKPQTLEAIRFARKAGVKIIVAANKMDKEGADINRVKQQLADNELMVEEWGGDIVLMPVSAKTNEGIPALLDMILLVADVEELRAEFDIPAEGLVIESHMEQGRGPVAVVLVQHGSLMPGHFVVAGDTYAKVKNLESTSGSLLKNAGPSTPAIVTGFKELPEFGEMFTQVKNEKEARSLAAAAATKKSVHGGSLEMSSGELLRLIQRKNDVGELNVIVKADVQGSLTSVIDSLKSLDTEEVAIRIVGSGVGTIGESDIHLAASTKALIYGFHVALPSSSKQLASRDKVIVRMYKVIYELLDDAKEELTKLLPPEIVETPLGRLVVKGVFKTTKAEVICGGEVTKGMLKLNSLAKVMRDGVLLSEVSVVRLQRGPQEAKEIQEGEMCGMSLKLQEKLDLQIGDHIEVFTREIKERTL